MLNTIPKLKKHSDTLKLKLKNTIKKHPILLLATLLQILHITDEFQRDWSGTDRNIILFWIQKVPQKQVALLSDLSQYMIGLGSILSFLVWLSLIKYLLYKFKKIRLFFYSLSFIIYFSLLSYLYSIELAFDFSIFFQNANTLLEKDFILAALPYLRIGPVFLAIMTFFILYKLEKKHHLITERTPSHPIKKGLFCLITYTVLIMTPIPSYDVMLSFHKSIYDYYTLMRGISKKNLAKDYELIQNSFQYSTIKKINNHRETEKKPHIFIIMVESFNASFVESRNETGKEFTPYFNQLIKKGIYVEEFYGNSVQSCKGQFATLTSLIPPISGFGFRHYYKTQYKTLSEHLKEAGYYNIFFQASGNLLVDNTQAFLQKNAFHKVETAKRFTTKEDDPYIFGWGMQDKRLYKHFFDYYDQHLTHKNKPIFAILPTIYSHNNTVEIPKKDRIFYKNATSSHEHYSNVIHLTDQQLQVFFDGLKERGILEDSIVIITGDHSRSAQKEQKISFNQKGYFDDIFKVPFLLVWEGTLPTKRIQRIAYSQIDIAPTLIDLLQLKIKKHHFQGHSIFTDKKDNTAFLVQPYNGIFLSVIQYPYKFIHHLGSGNTFLHNLQKDPLEQVNIQAHFPNITKQLKQKIQTIYTTSHLIKKNKIWMEKGP